MAAGPPPTAAKGYGPSQFVSLPAELDPADYDASLEKRRAEAERLAIRAQLKRQYQLQLNSPSPPAVIVSVGRGAPGMAARPRVSQRGRSSGCGLVRAVRCLPLLAVTLVSSLASGRGFVGRGAAAGANGVVRHGVPTAGPLVCEGRGSVLSSQHRKILPCSAGPMRRRRTSTLLSARRPRRPLWELCLQ